VTAPTIIDVAGRPARVRIDGDLSSPPVVLLHGIGRSLEDWGPASLRLAADYRVISLDIPGSGFSARRPGPATLTDFALGVLETLDALGETRPVHLMGHSLGGAIALQVQAIAPERVASLVLAGAAGFGSQVTPMMRLITLPVLGRLMTMRTTALSAQLAERTAFADPAFVTPARVEHALAMGNQPGSGAIMRETLQSLATVRGVRADWRQALLAAVARNPRPTLVVWGDQDRVLPASHLEAVRRLIPHAQTHLFTGAGHMTLIERADEFVALARDFIASSSTSAPSKRPTRSLPEEPA